MGKKTPKYIVFNKHIGQQFHEPVAWGDDRKELKRGYQGKAYQVMAVKDLAERDEW